jgi:putative spermidine/putrescine transport system substrate-binding protein
MRFVIAIPFVAFRVNRMTGNPAFPHGTISGSLRMQSLKIMGTTALSLLVAVTPAMAQVTEIGAGEGALNIVAWAGYIERGATDPAFDWVTKFEEASGCMVNVKTANTSDEMVALMNEGGFDLVTASGDASLRLIAGDRVQPVNIDLIPSWSTVDDRLKSAPWHTVDGVHYGVPYMWGPNVLMYNTEIFPEAPTSWNVVFEEMNLPDGQSNKGRIQAYDGPIHIADAAQYLMFHKPELGITSPYELNEDQYKAALDLLRAQRDLTSRYWHDAFIQMDDFKNEGVVASGSWPFQVNILKSGGAPIASTIPQEGATGWADTTMMHVDSANPNCAYMWMEHSLASNLQSDLSVWFGANPAVPAACTDGRGMQTAEGCTTNGLDNFDKIRFWTTPVANCSQGEGVCVPYYRWVSDYIGVIGGR